MVTLRTSIKNNDYYLISYGIIFSENKLSAFEVDDAFMIKYSTDGSFKDEFKLYNEIIFDFKLNGNELYLVQDKELRNINFETYKLNVIPIKYRNLIDAKLLFKEPIYYKLDSIFTPINLQDSSKFYFFINEEDSILEFDLRMNLVKKFPLTSISHTLYNYQNLRFISFKNECFTLNNDNKIIFQLNDVKKVISRNQKYYISYQNKLLIIDEKELHK